jgi:hypothetical protein
VNLTGPIYRIGGDPRIDDRAWYSLPPVPVLVNHQINKPFGRGVLSWQDEWIVCSVPVPHPVNALDFVGWGRLASLPYLDFTYKIMPSVPHDAPDGVQIVEVSLVREPNIFSLPGWTLEE